MTGDLTPELITLPASILDALREAVLVVDERQEITFMNAAARDLLGDHEPGRNLAVCVRHPTLLELVDRVLQHGGSKNGEMTLAWPVERTFAIHVVASQNHIPNKSAVVLLHETTDQRRLEQMRREFVANVSHELRSPLASLIGFIETLQGPARSDPGARDRFLEIMQNESQRMSRLIDDLLSLNQVEVGEHIQPQGRVDISTTLNAVKDGLEPQVTRRGNSLVIETPDEPLIAVGEEDEVRQVFRNLIDNASKYSGENSQIRIVVSAVDRIPDIGGAGIAISVIDQGAGIPSDQLPRLTERFYRVDKGRSRQMGGTGLGLAIVKHIVNRHRGRLTIRSEIGKGSTFSVFLHRAP